MGSCQEVKETSYLSESGGSIVREFMVDGIDMTPSDFKKKFPQLKDAVINKKLNSWGEFFNAAEVMLNYSIMGVIKEDRQEIIQMFREQVKDYVSSDKISPLADDEFASLTTGARFGALLDAGVMDSIMVEQKEILEQSVKQEFPKLIKRAEEESQLLRLCDYIRHYPKPGMFFKLPVFSYLSAAEEQVFFRAVMSHKIKTITWFLGSLHNRYKRDFIYSSAGDYLLGESSFVDRFNEYAKNRLDEEERINNPSIEKYQYVIAWLQPLIQEFKHRESVKQSQDSPL